MTLFDRWPLCVRFYQKINGIKRPGETNLPSSSSILSFLVSGAAAVAATVAASALAFATLSRATAFSKA